MNTAEDTRRKELAKIHIAKKDLVLDDETYRTIVRTIGKAESGSAADLSPLGRARVLQHFRTKGWQSRKRDRQPKRATPAGDVLASEGQVGKIRSFWIQMAEAGAVKERSEQALRAWVKSASRRHHEQHAGWSAPEFLPDWVAQKLIENLKAWARRCNIKLNE
ncbi:MAG: regulatory protein GemA [Pseudomonadota bacterium]